MSRTVRISDATYGLILEAASVSGKSGSEVVDDAFTYVEAMRQKLRYERVTGHCLRCGSKRVTKKRFV